MHSDYLIVFFVLFCTLHTIHAEDRSNRKIKKDPLTYTDADVEKLSQEWEIDDEDDDDDEEGKRQLSPAKQGPLVGTDPDKLFATMKKGQTTMIFAIVTGKPTKRETTQIADIWWTALRNALFDVHRYVVDTDRILFLVQDGSIAYDIKEYLIKQLRCLEVVIDNQSFQGRGSKIQNLFLKEL
ncbi:unnamed protein product [Adineta steineri]|uniref:Mesoderm development candidate 2 n=1 Tax=Adineta steineri TaxID=433720 RepID=A0A813SPE5_9BILA|nr:unnamed protein product [Adineta steineri]CAF1463272.1 unnamed protein product [Adineta steineri]